MKKLYAILFFVTLVNFKLFSQGSTCAQATQMCGNTPAFPALISTPGGSVGAANCLSTTPNESWFFMNVNTAGTIAGQITSTLPARDVDGAIWGPYTSVAAACADITDGTIPTPKACDYSGAATVPFNFAATTGFYVLVITNFSNAATSIDINITTGNSLICCPPDVTASNTCIGAGNTSFTTTGAAGGTWSVNGGGSITSGGVFTPTNPGCFTATYVDPVSGCSGQKIFTVFPSAPIISAPTNTCNSAFSLPGVPAANGFTVQYSIDGGTYATAPTIPTTPGCHTITARYVLTAPCGLTTQNTAGTGVCGVSNTVSVVIFPASPTIAAISNTCNSPLALPTVTAVSGFSVWYSIDGGPFAATATGPSSVGCHNIRAQYALTAACGNTPAGTLGTGSCNFSNTQYAVVFPPAPPAPTVTIPGSNLVVTPPPAIAGFEPQYSYDNGATWTTANNGPSADNCTGYQVLTRYTAQGCGSAPSLTPSTIAACASSPVIIKIKDTTPPVITCPANQTGFVGANCKKIVSGIAPTTSDNCNVASVTYSITGVTSKTGISDASGTEFNLGLSTVTYTATDGAGNTKTCSFTVTLTDNTPPTINCPPSQTIELSNACTTTMPNYAAQAVTSDNCGTVTVTQSPVAGSTICNNNGGGCGGPNYTVTLTATDASGNISTCSFNVEVKNNSPLVINCLAAQNLILNVNCAAVLPDYRNLISATDLCLGTGGITITQSPAPGTTVSGTGVQVVTFTATLGNKTTTCNVNINKIDSTPPSISCPLPITVNTAAGICTAVVPSIPATATDACGLASVTYTLTGATTFTSPTTGINNASGTTFNKGVTTVNYVATDLSGNIATCSFTVTVNDLELPKITCPANIIKTNDVGVCGANVTYTPPVGTDNCPSSTTVQIAGLSSGATFPIGTTTNTYKVTDASGNTATCSFTVTVTDTELPQINCPANIVKTNDVGQCGALVTYTTPTGTDNCTGSVTSLVSGLGSGSFFPVGTTTNIFKVTDATGNSATCSFTVTITDNQVPVITCPAEGLVFGCNTSAIAPLVYSTALTTVTATQFTTEGGLASDNCSVTTYQYQDAIVPTTCGLKVNRTWTISDIVGNTATCIQVYTIADRIPPTIVCAAVVSPISCQAVPVWPAPTVTDACDAAPVVTFADVTTLGACVGAYSITRTWTATDCSGNSATCSSTIIVQDITPPTGTAPANITGLQCKSEVPVADITAVTDEADNCLGTVVVTVKDTDNAATGCKGAPFIVTRTYTLTDCGGLTTDLVQTITVEDVTAPTGTAPANITGLQCKSEVPVADITAVTDEADNCLGTVVVTVKDTDNAATGCKGAPFIVTRTYTLTDCGGLTTDLVQTITVEDVTAPTGTAPANITGLQCKSEVPVADITAVTDEADNCLGTVVVTVKDTDNAATGCKGAPFIVTRTYTLTDCGGLTTDLVQTITVEDVTAPTGTAPANITGLQCKSEVPVADITAVTDEADNCLGIVVVTVKDTDNAATGCKGAPFIVTRTYTLTDCGGLTTDLVQTITVEDVTAPTGTAPANITGLQCKSEVPVADITAVTDEADNCLGTVVVTVKDTDNAATGCKGAPFIVTRTYTLTDCGGLTTDLVQTITVEDVTAPTGTAPANITGLQCKSEVPVADITAVTDEADNCLGTVVVTVKDTDNAATGCKGAPFIVTRTYTLTDCGGLTTDLVQTITVEDVTAPTGTAPANITGLQCKSEVPVADITAVTDEADNCLGTVVVTVKDTDNAATGCKGAPFIVTRTYTLTDCGGLTTDLVQTITVEDVTAPTGTAPANITGLQCKSEVPVADITAVTDEADNCLGTVVVTVKDTDNAATGCKGAPFIVTRTYTLTDCGGLTTDLVQTITVEDVTAPTGTAPANITGLQCKSEVPVADITAVTDEADNCLGTVVVTVKDTDNAATGCKGAPFIVTRTYTLTDCGGLTTDLVQTITVEDVTAPTGTAPANITGLQCKSEVPVADITAVTDEADNCLGTVVVTVKDTDNAATGCKGAPFIVTRTYTLTDCGGLTTDLVQTITVEDVTAPTGTAPANITGLQCKSEVPVADITAVTDEADNCLGTVVVTVKDTDNAATGCKGAPFIVTRTYTLTDCGGLTTDLVQTITVEDVTAPTGTAPANITGLQCKSEVPVADITAVTDEADNCLGTVVVTVKDTDNAATGCKGAPFIVTRTYTLTDCGGLTTDLVQTITVEDVTAPTGTAPANITGLQCKSEVPVADITAVTDEADNCLGTVVVTVKDTDNAATGCKGAPFIVTRTYTLTDCGGLTTDLVQTITVEDVTAPTGTAPANITGLQCKSEVPVADITAVTDEADNCLGTVVVTVKDTDNAATGCKGAPFIVTRTYTLTDCGGLTTDLVQTITVEDVTAPTGTAPANITGLQCKSEVPVADITAVTDEADNCLGTVVVTVKDTDNAATGCKGAPFIVTRTYTLTDCGGLTTDLVQTITVEDVTAPTGTAPANITGLQCKSEVPVADITAVTDEADNCLGTVVVTVKDTDNAATGCKGAPFIVTRTYTLTDCGGLTTDLVQTITVEDVTAPTGTAPANITGLQCKSEVPVADITAVTDEADNCLGTVVVTVKDTDNAATGCKGAPFIVTRTYTLTDCGGLTTDLVQTITVEDVTAPTGTAPANITGLQCKSEVPVADITAVTDEADNCLGTVVVTVKDTDNAATGCKGAPFIVTRTYTLTDCGGLTTDLVQTITVEDVTAPTGTAPANITGLQCKSEVPVADITAVTDEADNCLGTVVVTVKDTDNAATGCKGAPFIVTRTYTLTDCGGLTTDLVQTITVEDVTAPTGTAPANITGLQCKSEVPVADITAVTDEADNCLGTVVVTVKDTDNAATGCKGAPFIVTRTYTLTDCGGLTTDLVQTITVEDVTAPTGTAPANITGLQCKSEVPVADITAVTDEADNCLGTVVVTVKDTDNAATGCKGAPFIVTRTYTLTDCGGLTTDLVQTITVEDVTAPTGTAPANITGLQCKSEVPVADITAVTDEADNCLGTVVVTVKDTDNAATGCKGAPFIVTRTYTLTDCGGLTTDLVQTITVEDVTAPTGTAPANITGLQCKSEVPVADITAVTDEADNCLGTVVVTVKDTDNAATGCKGAPFIVTRTYTLTDCGGLTTDLVQTITVEDVTAPTGTAPANITGLQCKSEVPVADITAVTDEADNCLGTVVVTVKDTDNAATGCKGAPFIVTRTYTLTDCGGLTTDLVQTITVEDITPPVITCPTTDISVIGSLIATKCSYKIVANPITVSDNCSGAITTSFVLSGATTGTYSSLVDVIINVGKTSVSISATDACNNVSESCLFNYVVSSCAPLPVNLISFSGKGLESSIELNWKTNIETNFNYFELQKSDDAKEFGTIVKINGNTLKSYNYSDLKPNEGINYYRLKMIDIDGSFKFSNIINVNFKKEVYYVSVENPAENGVFKVLTNLNRPKLSLLNSSGRHIETIISMTGQNEFFVKVSNPIAGVYFLNIESDGKLQTRKVLVP